LNCTAFKSGRNKASPYHRQAELSAKHNFTWNNLPEILADAHPQSSSAASQSQTSSQPNAPHRLTLLRMRADWPYSRAAEKRDELAPFQLAELHLCAYRFVGQCVAMPALLSFTTLSG